MTLSAPAFRDREHTVQFYESDEYLAGAVSDFVANGLATGEPAIVIATEPHRNAFAARLHARAVDPARVTFLDARETLATFMDGAMPDPVRFRDVIGSRIAARGESARVRAYGEMVALLWQDGKPDAALRLEELWNDLADQQSFSLLCAYPMRNFDDGICRAHTHTQIQEQTKDEFLAMISHELRTPLTVILGWTHLLSLGGLDEETTRVALAMIEDSVRTQAATIDRIDEARAVWR